jgi:hypothetical protein
MKDLSGKSSDVTQHTADDGMYVQKQKASTLIKFSYNSLVQNQSNCLIVAMQVSKLDRPGNWLPVRGWPCSAGCRCSRRAEWGIVERTAQSCWNTETASCTAAEELWACTRTGSSSASTTKPLLSRVTQEQNRNSHSVEIYPRGRGSFYKITEAKLFINSPPFVESEGCPN